MPINGRRLIIVTLFYLAVCGLTTLMIKPFSIINFIGPAAGVATAFTIIWGAKVLFSIIFATFIFSAILNVTMGETLSFPILLICLSAICLQSFWAKQLTYTMVSQQNWLKSRNVLFSFMLKIGPVAGLVSGSAVVVVSMIYMQTFGNSTLYIFVSSWSSSILSTIFITPILLFTQGKQELSTTKRLFVVFASILGFLAVTLLFKVSQNFHQHERIEKFQNSKAKVLNLFNEEVEMISEQLLSTVALFQASDNVSAAEFSLFVSKIYRKNSSIRALEWIPEISYPNRDAFEAHASKELGFAYSIKEKNNSDQLLIADKRDEYLPVFYIYPKRENEKAFGLDLLNQSDRTIGLNLSFKLNQMIASAPLTLVQDKISNPGLLISYPIFNGKKLNVFSDEHKNEEKTLNGYILAVVQFEQFFNYTDQLSAAENIQMFVQDITTQEPFLLYGKPIVYEHEKKGRLLSSNDLDFFTRHWQIQINERQPWSNQDQQWQTWSMLMGGTLGGLVFQLLILMMAAYSIELSHQVALKTKELILAKENSEYKNLAKSQFLQTLSGELRTPIYAIKYYVAKFRQHPTFQQAEYSIEDISNASQNLTQLIDTVVDLAEIEYGTPEIKLVAFDFHDLLFRIERLLNASKKSESINFKFIINNNVPYVIECDELRIQKLIISLAENATKLLGANELNISIKGHVHQFKRATLFFVITPTNENLTDDNKSLERFFIDQDLKSFSISMAMALEVCQLFDGDVKVNKLATGNMVLTASIKVNLPPMGHNFTQSKEKIDNI